MFYQMIGAANNFVNPLRSQFNLGPHGNYADVASGRMLHKVVQLLPYNRIGLIDFLCKSIDCCSSFVAEMSVPLVSEFDFHHDKLRVECEFLSENTFFYIKCGMRCSQCGRISAISGPAGDTLFTKISGCFGVLILVFSKLNPDHFIEFLKSVEVDSLKLSNEQFLDDKRKNILMYCVSKTRSFYMVADCVRKQDYLNELLYQKNCDSETCFVLACKHNNFGLVKGLLQKYHYDWLRDGFDAIFALCENGNMLIFKHLLSTLKGDNVKMKLDSMRGSRGESILMITTFNTKIMETFLNFLIEEKLFYRLLYEKDAMAGSCLFWAAAF